MRPDNRLPDQLRAVRIQPHYLLTAEGSCLIEIGHTRVLCTATIEEGVPSWMRNLGRGWVTAEYSMLPRATAQRTPREINKGRPSGRTQEIQRLIGRSLRAIVDMEALGERTVIIDCDVLQADGGTRTASVTGGCVAMALAFQKMAPFGVFPRDPLRCLAAAASVGIIEGEARLDLCYEEDSQAEVDMNVVMTSEGEFIELQATAEKTAFGDARLAEMIALARKGIGELFAVQREAIGAK
ncbi:MAG: ribonuclease PH [Bryobacteraceae bacterium]|nr:ribonuclease PH [Bryobacteraceae bacterium]